MANRIQHTSVVSGEYVLERLDQVAAALFPQYSRAMLQAWIKSGELRVDGEPGKSSRRLSGGETLSIDALPEQLDYQPEELAIDILAEDDDILVVNKPAGLVVHPGAGNPNGTLLNALLYHFPQVAELPRAGIVHRLDKDTSGLMVVAKTLIARTDLVKQLSSRQVKRNYQAIVYGLTKQTGEISAPIGRHPTQRTRMAVVRTGKEAITRFQLIDRYDGFSHLLVSLETGRTHQIRVHMHHLGFPLVGDPVYGKKTRLRDELPVLTSFSRQALHAKVLSFVHPVSSKTVKFEQQAPQDFRRLLEELDAHA
jgi:23S rRNA pseudouridine1911/1915/1917 synthase